MTPPAGPTYLTDPDDRQQMALAYPTPGQLADFPGTMIKTTKTFYRAHSIAYSSPPWWFSSDGSGRFDLTGHSGTCYLAESRVSALREALGTRLVSFGVDRSELNNRAISKLFLPRPHHVANTTSAYAANHGITRELVSVTPYEVPHAWASAWADAGFDGIRYLGRLSTAIVPEARCLAVFHAASAADSTFKPDPNPSAAADTAIRAHMRILDTPTSPAGLTILPPPSAAAT